MITIFVSKYKRIIQICKSLRKLGLTCVRYIAEIAPRPAVKIQKFLASIFKNEQNFQLISTDFFSVCNHHGLTGLTVGSKESRN